MSTTNTREQPQANPQNALTRAMDLERALTEEDYATNSEALQECVRAWEDVRRAGPPS